MATVQNSVHLYPLLCKWNKKSSIQVHSYGITLHGSYRHLVNVTEVYTCFVSASCIDPVTLNSTATADLRGLTGPPKGVCASIR